MELTVALLVAGIAIQVTTVAAAFALRTEVHVVETTAVLLTKRVVEQVTVYKILYFKIHII